MNKWVNSQRRNPDSLIMQLHIHEKVWFTRCFRCGRHFIKLQTHFAPCRMKILALIIFHQVMSDVHADNCHFQFSVTMRTVLTTSLLQNLRCPTWFQNLIILKHVTGYAQLYTRMNSQYTSQRYVLSYFLWQFQDKENVSDMRRISG